MISKVPNQKPISKAQYRDQYHNGQTRIQRHVKSKLGQSQESRSSRSGQRIIRKQLKAIQQSVQVTLYAGSLMPILVPPPLACVLILAHISMSACLAVSLFTRSRACAHVFFVLELNGLSLQNVFVVATVCVCVCVNYSLSDGVKIAVLDQENVCTVWDLST